MVYLWQYSSSGNIDTVSDNTDVNMYILPEADWSVMRGENPGTPPPDDCEDCQTTLDCLIACITDFIAKVSECLSK
jgi:hypothetical protein